jgi:hypothetical protein
VARIRLIVGLITPHRIYLTIMKPVRKTKARFRAVVPLMMNVRILFLLFQCPYPSCVFPRVKLLKIQKNVIKSN